MTLNELTEYNRRSDRSETCLLPNCYDETDNVSMNYTCCTYVKS